MERIMHFELPAKDPARLKGFYSKVFGWKFDKWKGPTDYWMIDTGKGAGINGGMQKKDAHVKSVTNIIGVKDLDKTIRRISDAGGKVTVKKMPVEGMGWMVYFKDPDGNSLGAFQEDKRAA